MASAHNGILCIACNAECPDQQQLLLSQERFNMVIFVKAETHMMILYTTRKFVMATPTFITHEHAQKNLFDDTVASSKQTNKQTERPTDYSTPCCASLWMVKHYLENQAL